jgi:Ca-activated chloride channel family protein
MRTFIAVALVSIAPFIRETNSNAAAKRGAKAYAEASYNAAVSEFENAQKLAPSPLGAFNLGTAQVAAANRPEGSATLAEAMKDPALRADALFNRGNSALAAKAFDHAVRDFTEVLKLRPNDAAAKRNHEIALTRSEQARRAGASGQQNQANQQNDQKNQQSPSRQGQQEPRPGEIDLEALLRSVQQQEQEELRRMKARAAETKVGW